MATDCDHCVTILCLLLQTYRYIYIHQTRVSYLLTSIAATLIATLIAIWSSLYIGNSIHIPKLIWCMLRHQIFPLWCWWLQVRDPFAWLQLDHQSAIVNILMYKRCIQYDSVLGVLHVPVYMYYILSEFGLFISKTQSFSELMLMKTMLHAADDDYQCVWH